MSCPKSRLHFHSPALNKTKKYLGEGKNCGFFVVVVVGLFCFCFGLKEALEKFSFFLSGTRFLWPGLAKIDLVSFKTGWMRRVPFLTWKQGCLAHYGVTEWQSLHGLISPFPISPAGLRAKFRAKCSAPGTSCHRQYTFNSKEIKICLFLTLKTPHPLNQVGRGACGLC